MALVVVIDLWRRYFQDCISPINTHRKFVWRSFGWGRLYRMSKAIKRQTLLECVLFRKRILLKGNYKPFMGFVKRIQCRLISLGWRSVSFMTFILVHVFLWSKNRYLYRTKSLLFYNWITLPIVVICLTRKQRNEGKPWYRQKKYIKNWQMFSLWCWIYRTVNNIGPLCEQMLPANQLETVGWPFILPSG